MTEPTLPAVDGTCEECGFDYDGVPDADVADRLRSFGRRYRAPLTRGLPGESLDDLVRARPEPEVWSALEYACHMRDVLAVQRDRLAQAVAEDQPTFVPMGRDQRAIDGRYNEQDPAVVVDELAANAEAMADACLALSDAEWDRTGVYGYPQPTERNLRWVARHTIHEGHHHLLDIGRSLRHARGR